MEPHFLSPECPPCLCSRQTQNFPWTSFLTFFFFLPFLSFFFFFFYHYCSKPATWAPHWSSPGQSKAPVSWCWTWRWSRSTTSSTSEAAPSFAWRYTCRNIRSEETAHELFCACVDPPDLSTPEKAALHGSAMAETARLLLFIFLIIMSSPIKTLQIKTRQSSADGKKPPCAWVAALLLLDAELLRPPHGLWTPKDVYNVQFLTSSSQWTREITLTQYQHTRSFLRRHLWQPSLPIRCKRDFHSSDSKSHHYIISSFYTYMYFLRFGVVGSWSSEFLRDAQRENI